MMIPPIVIAMAIAALILLVIAAFVFMRCWIGCERDLILLRREHARCGQRMMQVGMGAAHG